MKECVNKCKYYNTSYCDEECGSYIPKGYKLRDIDYNSIHAKGLSIIDGDNEVAMGFVGEVLKQIVNLADREVKSCNYFFDTFVIRI